MTFKNANKAIKASKVEIHLTFKKMNSVDNVYRTLKNKLSNEHS